MITLSDSMIEKLNKTELIELFRETQNQNAELQLQLKKLSRELQDTNQKLQIILEKWNPA